MNNDNWVPEANGDMIRLDAVENGVRCECGALVSIYMDDGEPGCRDIEVATCPVCRRELARHFGTCDARLIEPPKRGQ